MKDICNFLPGKKQTSGIEYFHFVYESNFRKLAQPFYLSQYRMHLVFKGEGTLRTGAKEYKLSPGTLFLTFPRTTFELKGSSNFTYLYITFDGIGTNAFLDSFHVSPNRFVFENLEHLREFWMNSIRRVTPANATTLTESVMLYSLSFIEDSKDTPCNANRFNNILSFIETNFADPTLSVKKIADIHFYSEKHFSALFKKKTGVRFTEYINRLRIEYSLSLMDGSTPSVSAIALKCGFSDPLYFSKVFKKSTGMTPSEYIKSKTAVKTS